jgi:hypothetical protein
LCVVRARRLLLLLRAGGRITLHLQDALGLKEDLLRGIYAYSAWSLSTGERFSC